MSSQIPVREIDPNTDGPSDNNKKKPETVELYANRKKIYVREVKGLFQRIRFFSLMALMLLPCALSASSCVVCPFSVSGAGLSPSMRSSFLFRFSCTVSGNFPSVSVVSAPRPAAGAGTPPLPGALACVAWPAFTSP